MNKNILLSFLAVFAVSMASCQRITPEIVDPGKAPDPAKPKGIDRSKIGLPPVDLLTQYLYFKENNQERIVFVEKKEETETVADIEDVTVAIETSIPVEKEFTAELEVMTVDNAPKTYPEVIANGARKVLTAEMYTLSEKSVTFKAGEKEKSLKISFNKETIKSLKEGETYVLPLILKISDDTKKLVNLHNFFLVSLKKQTVLPLPNGNNINVMDDLSDELEQIDSSTLKLSTNGNTSDHLKKLIDGNDSYQHSNWWVSNPDTYLDIKLAKKTTIKAIALWTLKHTQGFYYLDKSIRKMKVLVSNNAGARYVLQGEVKLDAGQKIVVVTFPQPVEIDAIRLTGFEGVKYDKNSDGTVDIHEIRVYTKSPNSQEGGIENVDPNEDGIEDVDPNEDGIEDVDPNEDGIEDVDPNDIDTDTGDEEIF